MKTVSGLLPCSVITGFIVSMVTNELSVILASVMIILFPLEFVAVIENVTFPFVSPDETVVVNSALPPLVVCENVFPSRVPLKLPRSVPSVWSSRVISLPVFAKLPPLLEILSDVIVIGSASITVTVLFILALCRVCRISIDVDSHQCKCTSN